VLARVYQCTGAGICFLRVIGGSGYLKRLYQCTAGGYLSSQGNGRVRVFEKAGLWVWRWRSFQKRKRLQEAPQEWEEEEEEEGQSEAAPTSTP